MENHNANRRPLLLATALMFVLLTVNPVSTGLALAASASEIDRSVTQVLTILYKNKPDAKVLADKAVAMLVFPSIVKGGLIIGGQFGDGALRRHGMTVAYYRSAAASYGFQAGADIWLHFVVYGRRVGAVSRQQ